MVCELNQRAAIVAVAEHKQAAVARVGCTRVVDTRVGWQSQHLL